MICVIEALCCCSANPCLDGYCPMEKSGIFDENQYSSGCVYVDCKESGKKRARGLLCCEVECHKESRGQGPFTSFQDANLPKRHLRTAMLERGAARPTEGKVTVSEGRVEPATCRRACVIDVLTEKLLF